MKRTLSLVGLMLCVGWATVRADMIETDPAVMYTVDATGNLNVAVYDFMVTFTNACMACVATPIAFHATAASEATGASIMLPGKNGLTLTFNPGGPGFVKGNELTIVFTVTNGNVPAIASSSWSDKQGKAVKGATGATVSAVPEPRELTPALLALLSIVGPKVYLRVRNPLRRLNQRLQLSS